MNIFGIGITELLLILLIALVVAGPKRMIRWAYVAGVYSAKLRTMWLQAVDVMQREVDDAGLDVKLPREMPTRQNITRTVTDLARPYTKDLEDVAKEVQKPLQSAIDETKAAARQVKRETSLTQTPVEPPQKAPVNHQIPPESLPDEATFGAWGTPQPGGDQRN